jgi:hypothetical protein
VLSIISITYNILLLSSRATKKTESLSGQKRGCLRLVIKGRYKRCWSYRGVHLSVEGKRCCIDLYIKKEEVRVAGLTTYARVFCRVGVLSRSLSDLLS